MSQSPFATPADPSERIDYNEVVGNLLLIKPTYLEDHIPNVNTKPGEKSPAVRADVSILDGPQAGRELADVLIFPKVLQSQLRSRVGQLVLGRLGKGEAKAGQSAPWKLNAASPDDERTAEAHLSNRSTPATTPPAGGRTDEPPF